MLPRFEEYSDTEGTPELYSDSISVQTLDPIDKLTRETLMRDPKKYFEIPEIPVYEPTASEFEEPLTLFKKLQDICEKYGAIKIRAPESFCPKFSIPRMDKTITTRVQILNELTKGEPFEQNVNKFTFEEYKEYAEKFSLSYQRKLKIDSNNEYRINEIEYWCLVEDPQFTHYNVEVEYGADLPSRRYGSAFPISKKSKLSEENEDSNDEANHNFNLNNISQSENSLFQIITRKTENISGITSPWLYNGMLFSTFCWHVEDMYMPSVNYMHKGAAKTWYVIPGEYKEKFDEVFRKKYAHLLKNKPELLYSIVMMINPLELMENGIPVYRTEQHPREYIITCPKAYHSGFSHGYNLSEAVNIATPEWIKFSYEAAEDYKKNKNLKQSSYPNEWLIVENIRLINYIDMTDDGKKIMFKEFEDMIYREIAIRENIKECYKKLAIKKFDDALTRYDAITCSSCKNYCYLSHLSCGTCKKVGCPSHFTICKCLNSPITLNIRFTEDEMLNFASL